MTAHIPLGEGREFAAIRALLEVWGPRARGIGDDAAVLDVPPGERLVVSTDTSVDGVHFRRDWLTPAEIGWRATMAALSDLAAMGAAPLGIVLAITCPAEAREHLLAYAYGVGEALRVTDTVIVGGDLSGGATLSFGVTVFGSAGRPVGRAGAQPGDGIWVSGALGGPAAALAAWERGEEPLARHRERFAAPVARLALGRAMAAAGATAAIDISDGLLADAGHVARASGVELRIALEDIPVLAGGQPRAAAVSGEEYELLFTAPSGFDPAPVAAAGGVAVTRIGTVGAGAPAVVCTEQGSRVEITGGYDHFSR